MSNIRNQQLLAKIHTSEDNQTRFKSDVTNQFKVTISRSSDPKADGLTQKQGQTDFAKRLNVSASTIIPLIQELKHQGKIQRIGSKRGGAREILS